MEELLTILESLTAEQYKKFFNNKPIFTPAIKYRKSEYIQMLSSGDEHLKTVLNKLIDNNVNIVNSTFDEGKTTIEFIIAKDDLKFIKYIKDHINLGDLKISLLNNCISIKMTINDVRSLIILKQLIENYLTVNPLTNVSDRDISTYILESYKPVNEEYLVHLKEVNKNDIMYLREKHRQKEFQFGNNDFFEIDNPLQNNISIFEIYNKDSKFQSIPYEKLTNDMKYVMCNKYFQNVFETRLKIVYQILIEQYKTIFYVNFNKQQQLNLTNYGITGNLPPFDNRTPHIEIFLHGNLNFCKIDGEKAIFNEDLFGQVLLTILHEHEHILQRIGLIDEKLKTAINAFESLSNENSNYYIDNYYQDPAELDANLTSFIRFNNIAHKLGITNPDNIIIKKVKHIILAKDKSFNAFQGSTINNINDVYNILSENLDQSIKKYLNNNGKKI